MKHHKKNTKKLDEGWKKK